MPAVNKLVFRPCSTLAMMPAYGKVCAVQPRHRPLGGYITLGVGAFMSEVIPVKRSDPAFQNISAMVKVGVGSRLFLTKFMALNAFLSMYGYPDTFEPVANVSYNRDTTGACRITTPVRLQAPRSSRALYASCRKANGKHYALAGCSLRLGLSFYLPPKFEYKGPR